jgi:cytochrome c biogenesis protein CcmG/thiol:disulfide interchange protein DsbE
LVTVAAVAGIVSVVVTSSSDTSVQPPRVSEPPPQGGVNRGDLAPDFELTTLDGRTVRLRDLRGRPVILNFWASWCYPCRAEFPELRDAYRTHAAKGLEVLGIVSWNDIESDARDFVREQRASWPMPVDRSKKVEEVYSVPYMPQTFFVDREGRIQLRVYAQLTQEVLDRGLRMIL